MKEDILKKFREKHLLNHQDLVELLNVTAELKSSAELDKFYAECAECNDELHRPFVGRNLQISRSVWDFARWRIKDEEARIAAGS